jgi:spore germination cell wall hydrolase CwlJ-like protein
MAQLFQITRPITGRRPILATLLFTLAALGIIVINTAPAQAGSASVREELHCLALNIYFEARGEPDRGKQAVGHVVMNRIASNRYPDTACEVVKQGGEDRLHRCQFSWWCDGRSDTPRDSVAWEHSKAVAQQVYWALAPDPTRGALWYHADYVSPSWRKQFARGPRIGEHIFYLPTADMVASAADTAPVAR